MNGQTSDSVDATDRRHLQVVLGREPSVVDLARYRPRRSALLLRQPPVVRRRAARVITRR